MDPDSATKNSLTIMNRIYAELQPLIEQIKEPIRNLTPLQANISSTLEPVKSLYSDQNLASITKLVLDLASVYKDYETGLLGNGHSSEEKE